MLARFLIVTLPFFIGLVWSATLFLEYRRPDPARKMLAWFILANTLLLMSRFLLILCEKDVFDLCRCMYIFFSLAVYPVGYLYVRRLTSPTMPQKKELWLLSPAVIASVAGMTAYFVKYVDWKPVLIFARVILPIEVLLLAVFGQMAIRDYRRNLENYYSDTTGMGQKPMYRLMVIYVAGTLLRSIGIAAGLDLNSNIFIIGIVSAFYSFIVFAISYVGSKASFNAGHFAAELKKEAAPARTQRHDSNLRVQEVMTEQQLFLKPGLKITDVAMELGSNRTYVSEYINSRFGQSFSDYVNSLRVEYAQKLMADSPGRDLVDIYTSSGFASEAAFFRNFKKFASMPPNVYRCTVLEQDCNSRSK